MIPPVPRRWLPILGLAFVVRLAAGILSGSTVGGDAGEYLRLAHNLAAGHGFSLASHAPFVPTDWRLPGYPALLMPVDWFGAGHTGIVVLNSLLGTAAVGAIALIARQLFAERPRMQLSAVLVAALYPPLVTFSGLVLVENLLFVAGSWFLYLAFYSPMATRRPLAWLAGIFVTALLLSLSRSEGVAMALVGMLLASRLRRLPLALAVGAIAAVLVAPAAWIVRNDVAVQRIQLTDSMYLYTNLLLSFNNGSATDPLYLRGVALAYDGTSSADSRSRYESDVSHYVSDRLRHSLGSVLSFKVKGFFNFFFVPPVWNWALERFSRNYTLGDAIRHPGVRNAIRFAWSLLLIAQYLAAALGLRLWWRRKQYRDLCGLLLYPLIALVLTIPFQADQRAWTFAAFLLILPAVEGAFSLLSPRAGTISDGGAAMPVSP
jgi:hypothetical protein